MRGISRCLGHRGLGASHRSYKSITKDIQTNINGEKYDVGEEAYQTPARAMLCHREVITYLVCELGVEERFVFRDEVCLGFDYTNKANNRFKVGPCLIVAD